tara:strand:+ start:1725 stop:2825 length:1101 start_codon:yes stop_codon:yes gene_type:complete
MEGRHFAIAIAIFAIISLTKGAVADSEFLIEEDLDSPATIWSSDGVGDNWIIVPGNNSTIIGTFELNDSVDLYAIEISSSNWTTIRFSVSGNDSVSISLQRLNQSTWSIEEYANEDIGEISLDKGFHAIRLERLGSYDGEVDYRFIIRNVGSFDESGEYVNLAWMFAPFYVFAGFFLILPMLVVVWWNRENILTSTFRSSELEQSEVQVLSLLRERFSADRGNVDFEEVNAALSTLGRGSWGAISEEFGKPEIRHFTENIDISLWRMKGGFGSFLIGIKTGRSKWEMAAIRINTPLGEPIKVDNVLPEMMFQDDEVYLGNLEEETTTFIRLEVLGKAPEAEIHISGIVEGSPIAAVPAKTIAMEEE